MDVPNFQTKDFFSLTHTYQFLNMDPLIQALFVAVPAFLLSPGVLFKVPKQADFTTQAAVHALIFAGVHYWLRTAIAKN